MRNLTQNADNSFHIKSLKKRHKETKTDILQESLQFVWISLADGAKMKHSLVKISDILGIICRGCLENKEYRQILAKVLIRGSKLSVKAPKQRLIKDKFISNDVNSVVKKPDTVYKNVFIKAFTSSAGITNTLITALNRQSPWRYKNSAQ